MGIDLRWLRPGVAGATPSVTRLIAALAGSALLVWSGVRVSREGAVKRADLESARATLSTFADWRQRYQPAVAAESIAWRRTLMELHSLGVIGDERLALTQSVARAAEVAGLSTPEMLDELGRRHIPINYSVDDLKSDLTALKNLS